MRSLLLISPLLISLCSGFFVAPRHKESLIARDTFFQKLRPSAEPTSTLRDEKVMDFVERARSLGPVGTDRTKEERGELASTAKMQIAKLSDKKPARASLSGLHKLVYSASPGGSSGKIGPLTGKVTQEFVDDTIFINAVELGPLKIALRAEREIKSDTTIKVTFRETTVTLFGIKVTSKTIENSGGVWKYLFSGVIETSSGKRKLIRIIETPSLFVLESEIN
mmetsp:Transcript_15011/g.28448  ORF Transcript_15011/g.28448 Transcript_15011/m.28448 type:complete len:223 (+) Transcript_15011:47-715(+)